MREEINMINVQNCILYTCKRQHAENDTLKQQKSRTVILLEQHLANVQRDAQVL